MLLTGLYVAALMLHVRSMEADASSFMGLRAFGGSYCGFSGLLSLGSVEAQKCNILSNYTTLIKFWVLPGKSVMETLVLIQKVFGSESLWKSAATLRKTKAKAMLIVMFDAKGAVHHEVVAER